MQQGKLADKMKNIKHKIVYLIFCFIFGCNNQKEFQPLVKKEVLEEAKTFNIEIDNYCIPQSNQRISFFLINRNYHLTSEKMISDFDGDGVADVDESSNYGQSLGIDEKKYDSNIDGYSDGIIFYSGISLDEQNKLEKCGIIDSDNDGLPDCAEALLGTNDHEMDTDKDGIPDELEIFTHLNPLSPDGLLDTDLDGISNFNEVSLGTPWQEKNQNNQYIADHTLMYEQESISTNGQEQCFRYHIKNIPYEFSRNDNVIEFYFAEQIAGKIQFKIFSRKIKPDLLKNATNQKPAQFFFQYADLLKETKWAP